MRSGDLSDRIALEEITGLGDGAWTPRATGASLWAAVALGGGGDGSIRIRYRNDLKSDRDLGRGLRALWKGHVLTITDVSEVVRGREVNLTCHDVIVTTDVLATGAHQVTGRLADGTDQ